VLTVSNRLKEYLHSLTGKAPAAQATLPPAGTAIVVGDFALAREYELDLPQSDRPESFVVSQKSKGKLLVLVIAGQTDQGIKRGIYHIMQNLTLRKGKLLLRNYSISGTPYILYRGSHLGGYTRRVFGLEDPNIGGSTPVTAPSEQIHWNHFDNWDVERVADYLDMLDFFGYNMIETSYRLYLREERARSPEEEEKEQRWLDAFLGNARRNGLRLQIQFNGTMFGPGGSIPYGKETKIKYEEFYSRVGRIAGPHLDSVVTHWVDAGGWKSTKENPCTIELLQDLHVQIDGAFRKVNPNIETMLSLWFLDHRSYKFWEGYEGVETILNSGRIPPHIGISQSRTYQPVEARKIIDAGHKLGVWGWYIADHELVYTMHVHTHPLRNYFRNLPKEAGESLYFHTLSNCQAETNIYTIYLGARMMWNPRNDPEVYLREVASLVYGPKNEAVVFQALKAIGDIRCGKKCRGYWRPQDLTEEKDLYDGIQSYNAVGDFETAYQQATAAWNGLKEVQIDKEYTPPLRFHRPVETLFAELKGHVEAVAMYMQFLKDRKEGKQPPTEVPSSKGPFEYYERMQYLDPDEQYWPFTVVQ
jgi:hypothetical protein